MTARRYDVHHRSSIAVRIGLAFAAGGLLLAVAGVLFLKATMPANAAGIAVPDDGLSEVACHDAETVGNVAGLFGPLVIAGGESVAQLATKLWTAAGEQPPARVAALIAVVGVADGAVRVFPITLSRCVRDYLVLPAATFLEVWHSDALP